MGHSDVQDVLSSGVNNKWAVLPHADIDKILEASFGDILDKVNRIYAPAGEMDSEQGIMLESFFEEILKMPFATNEDIAAIHEKLMELVDDSTQYANGYARQRLVENLKYLATILEARSMIPIIVDEEPIQPDPPVTPPDDNLGDEDPLPEEDTDTDDKKEENEGESLGGDATVEEPQNLGFFEMLILAIINFFRKLFGLA